MIIRNKSHKDLILLAILAACITYQAGLNPLGGIWSDVNGHVAGNPVLLDIHPRRYKIFFWFNSISFMASIVVIMFLLNKPVREKDVPLWALHIIMLFDLLALMTAFASGSCRKFRTSVYVYALVVGVVIYLVIVIFVSSGIAKYLRSRSRERSPNCTSGKTHRHLVSKFEGSVTMGISSGLNACFVVLSANNGCVWVQCMFL
ncbi:hypothetical protein BAE44_0002641 [Dichanthelium oligosanthes]|uniref:PGG domain-containing protein n=1 Tax=Dichanthelium oligosanthes TaxID=888268 RepID=A0A1E5WGS4_9POAL|nr:hypothetical protein BAE44_0002641 [Dichanthelium oligosanthes]